MNIFDRMSQKSLEITSKKSNGLAFYGDDFTSRRIYVVLNKDVDLIGEYGQSIESIVTIELSSSVTVMIGGEFLMPNGDSYVVDSIISNDDSIQVASVVKQ